MTSHTPGAFDDRRNNLGSKQSKRPEKEKVEFEDTRDARSKMAI